MKELTIEQKAQRFVEALERARKWYDSNTNEGFREIFEDIFYELKESEDEISEDEKMCKVISDIILIDSDEIREILFSNDLFMEDIDAWLEKQKDKDKLIQELGKYKVKYTQEVLSHQLEKQGEQKPAYKVESKIKAGDWVVCNNGPHHIFQVIERSWPNAKYRDINGNEIFLNVETLDKQYHLWTIKDAKDGDVLFMDNGLANCIFIYKSSNNGIINKYASYNKFGFESEHYLVLNDGYVIPATKEQHDALMKTMTNAGYEFDFKKKELKKIEDEKYNGEDYGIDGLFHAQRILEKSLGKVDGYQSNDGILEHKCAISAVKKLYEQKPTEWSEEDEIRMDNICHFLGDYGDQYYGHLTLQDTIKWLKSFKNRVMSQNLTATDEEITQAKKGSL